MTGAPRTALGAGYDIPRIIIGGWQLAAGHSTATPDRDALFRHWDMLAEHGLDTFDCADIYLGVEALIGDYVRARPGRRVQVHTKFVPDRAALATLDRSYIERVVFRSCERLGVATLDLVQLHWWDYRAAGMVEAALELDALRQAGVIRHVGLTNTDAAHVEAILDAGVPLVANQVQYSLLDRRPAGDFSSRLADRDVALLCYGAVAGGFLSERWLGAEEPIGDVENRSLVKYRLMIQEHGGWAGFQRLLLVLARIAARHDVGIGSVAQRWALDQPGVGAVIVGMRSEASARAAAQTLALALSAQDRAELDTNVSALPAPTAGVYELEREMGGRHAAVMKYDLNARQARA